MADQPRPAAAGSDDGCGQRPAHVLITGNGNVVQPSDGVLGIGSGGNFAVAAARALLAHANLSAVEIVRTALGIAAGIDVYTNNHIVVEEMKCEAPSP